MHAEAPDNAPCPAPTAHRCLLRGEATARATGDPPTMPGGAPSCSSGHDHASRTALLEANSKLTNVPRPAQPSRHCPPPEQATAPAPSGQKCTRSAAPSCRSADTMITPPGVSVTTRACDARGDTRTLLRSDRASLPASRTSHWASSRWPRLHAFSSAVSPSYSHKSNDTERA